jgi:hypothetical protein
VVLEHGNHLVDDFHGSMALALALPDLLRVAAALDNCSRLGLTLATGTRDTPSHDRVQLTWQRRGYGRGWFPY